MKHARWVGVALGAALAVPSASAQAFALRLKGEEWTYGFAEKNAYFDSSANYAWLELLLRAQATLELGDHFVLEGRLAGSSTVGKDYFSDDNEDAAPYLKPLRYDGRLDLLSLNFERLAGGKLNLKFGRQEISYGEGFLIADGYSEYGSLSYRQALAAEKLADNGYGGTGQWIIPYKSWDAARASIDLDPVALDFMVARLDWTTLSDPDPNVWGYFPGILAAADVAWSGEVFGLGGTLIHRSIFGTINGTDADEDQANTQLEALSVRASASPDDWKIEAEGVGELQRDSSGGSVPAFGGRLNVKHTWGMNPFSPWVRASAYYFSGSSADGKVGAYDPLYYDWVDFGRWYLGNLGGAWLANSDEAAIELAAGFQPTPLQNVKLMLYGLHSASGNDACDNLGLDCGGTAYGKLRPIMAEANLMWDWAPAEVGKWKPDGRWYFGAEGAVAMPLGQMTELAGSDPWLELMLFMTVNF